MERDGAGDTQKVPVPRSSAGGEGDLQSDPRVESWKNEPANERENLMSLNPPPFGLGEHLGVDEGLEVGDGLAHTQASWR